MARDFERSDKTNRLFDELKNNQRMGIILRLPDVGEIEIEGDTLREFLWTVRSHNAIDLIQGWLQRFKLEAAQLRQKRSSTPMSVARSAAHPSAYAGRAE